MNLQEKIVFLQESMKLDDRNFAFRYGIKTDLLKKWKKGKIIPSEKEMAPICNEFGLVLKDFMNDKSTLSSDVKKGEHPCKLKPKKDRKDIIYEDYAREDNSRYEEKD